MTKPFIPTNEQIAAIDSSASMVITACAGSGKTKVIVEKIKKELKDIKSHKGIIGITFTVKASKELKRKCSADAFDIKRSFFGTIDHFCLSEIIYPFYTRIFGIEKRDIQCITYSELDEIFKVNLPDLNASEVVFTTDSYELYHHEFLRHLENGFILLEAVGVIANKIVEASLACQRYLLARYTSVYVDEYQDSSQAQHKLFLNLLSIGLRAVAVGDIQQSIYAWRGSSPMHIQELVSRRDLFEHHIVNINHRCHPSIVNYSNRLFSPACILHDADSLRVFRRVFNGTQIDLAVELNTYIPQTAENFGVKSLNEVAVLVRNNQGLRYLRDGLNIPNRIYTDDALNAINTRATNLFSDLLKYRFDPNFLTNDVTEFEQIGSKLSPSKIQEIRKNITQLAALNNGELEGKIIDVAASLLQNEISIKEISALRDVISNPDMIAQYSPSSKEEVQIMTLHKSKGLEFEIVFHLDMYEWIFPYRQYTSDFNKPVYPTWDQELNLHYVGITRAKTACILAYSNKRLNSSGEVKKSDPSAFLNSISLEGLFD
jgi:DNA helicase II / ATP-dependent DNA helicase PcrA